MKKILKLAMIFNKSNKQISMSLPKKQLSPELRKKLSQFKKIKFRFEGLE